MDNCIKLKNSQNLKQTLIKEELLVPMLTNRQSNFELLRIVAMLFIVMHHYAVHGGITFTSQFTFNKIFLQMLAFGGKVGVNIFIMISGYFLICEHFKLRKLIKLMFQMWFYSLAILILIFLFNFTNIDLKVILKSILPIGLVNWFAFTYFVFYLIFPFENILLRNISQKEYLLMLISGGILWFVFPTISNIFGSFSIIGIMGLFSYLYAIGAYIRIYCKKTYRHVSKIAVYTYLLYMLSSILFDLLSLKYNFFINKVFYFCDEKSIFLLIISISLLLYFKDFNLKYNKYINYIGATTFGIYLMHDNNYVRHFLWQNIFQNYIYYNTNFLVLHAIISILMVFVFCSFIDFLRLKFIEKPLFRYLNPKINVLENKLHTQLDLMLDKIIKKT